MHPVATAIAPLKTDAMNRAEQEAKKLVAHLTKELKSHSYDLNKVAPPPNSLRMSTRDYRAAKAKRDLFCMIVKTTQTSYNAPLLATVDSTKVERFIEMSRGDAAAQYDAFIAKLVNKIGPCLSATIKGNHVWGYSILTVTKADATIERWKTQMIVNTSKLGKLFNQWPSRRMK